MSEAMEGPPAGGRSGAGGRDHAVAEDVGVGCVAGGVALEHGVEDAGPVLLDEPGLEGGNA